MEFTIIFNMRFFLGKQVSEQKVKKEFRMTYENHGHAKSDAIGINPT